MTTTGIRPTGSILDQIVVDKREALEKKKQEEPEDGLLGRVRDFDEQWMLSRAIIEGPRGPSAGGQFVRVIAEIKKASPTKGRLVARLDHQSVARTYTLGGAAGISIVTEQNHFQGNLNWLRDVRMSLKGYYPGGRPALLRKDFLTEPYEITQSRAYGAEAVLLIVALLEDALLKDLLQLAESLSMEGLVEVHNESEAERAVTAGATLIGINNRDLHTFEVDLATTERIRQLLPREAVVIGESGIHTKEDMERLYVAGVNAVLIGESLMTAPDVGAKLRELRL